MKLGVGFILTLAVALFVLAAPQCIAGEKDLTKELGLFFDNEAKRSVTFPKTKDGAKPAFDIIILHVCSLGWDDMEKAEINGGGFFKKFDFVFTKFNTVTSHSGPAAIRLLRSACGQPRHGNLYNKAPNECYLFENLAKAGFTTEVAFNHDGKYGGFTEDVTERGNVSAKPMDVSSLPQKSLLFDGSPIYGDYDTLDKWLENRTARPSDSFALYYNTITLHDGTHDAGEKQWWKKDRGTRFKDNLARLFAGFEKFFARMESMGRKAIVIFAAEHGKGLRGNGAQKPGERTIPSPDLTKAPLAIKLIGLPKIEHAVIDKPVGHLAMAYLIASFLNHNPFTSESFSFDSILKNAPETRPVADNGEAIVMESEGVYYVNTGKGWEPLPGKHN